MLPRLFFKSAILSVPLHVLSTVMVMIVAGAVSTHYLGTHGTVGTIGGWSLTALTTMLGLVAGIVTGLLYSGGRTIEAAETDLRARLHQLPPRSTEAQEPRLSIDEIRTKYETVFEGWMEKTLGRIRLPRFLDRLIRTQLREAIVTDFVASCQARGLTTVGAHEFRNWLLTKGLALGLMPVHDQLAWWRYLIFGALGLLALVPLAIAFLMS